MASERPVVVVTGSSGFIGAPLVSRLSERYRVVALDRVGPPHPPPGAECLPLDLADPASIRDTMSRIYDLSDGRVASVVHLAAYYDFSGEDSPLYDKVTVRGTEHLLEYLQDFEAGQFLFSSTMLVHAPCSPGERINEDWPIQPKWPYPKSKAAAEEMVARKRGSIPAVLARIASVYDDGCHLIPLARQIQRIVEGRITGSLFPGDLTHGVSYLHLDDLLDALERVVELRGQLPECLELLLGEEETPSYGELQTTLGRLLRGLDWQTFPIPRLLAKIGAWGRQVLPFIEDPFIKPWMIDLADDHYALDTRRARELLGWQPKRSIRETLPRMVSALKRDPVGWYREHGLNPPKELLRAAEAAQRSRHAVEAR